jgi:molecular chaperone DnaK
LGRNGATAADWPELVTTAKALAELSLIRVVAVFSHLSSTGEAEDLAQIDTAVAEMNAAWTAASEEMYKATQEGGVPPQGEGAQPQGDGSANAENVTDAEFEEVK